MIQDNSLIIGSKLDKDISAKQCRLAFYGQVLHLIKSPETELPKINVIKEKTKVGKVDRITDDKNILVSDLFSKETNPNIFIGLKLKVMATDQDGTILGTFGKSGKLKVRLETATPEGADILGSEVHLFYKKSIWEDKGKKKNKFKFN